MSEEFFVTQTIPVSSDFGITGATAMVDERTGKIYTRNLQNQVIDITSSSNQSFAASGSGAITDTVQNVLRERISVLRFIPANLHAGIRDGTGTTDLASYIALAITAAAGKCLLWPAGYYYIASTKIEVTTSQIWMGDGLGATEIEWNAGPASSVCLDVFGPDPVDVGVAPNSVAAGDATLVFASDPGTLTGLLLIRDSANSSFSGFRTDYKNGEIVEILSQSTVTITPRNRLMGTYTASSTFKAFTFAPIIFQTKGITFTFPSDSNLGARFRQIRHLEIDGCKATGASLETVEVGQYCFQGKLINSHAVNNAAASADQYGFALEGVQDFDIIGCSAMAARHGLSMGGSAIPNRQVRVTGGRYEHTNEAAGQYGIDCHGNAEFVTFTNVQATGAFLAGDNIKWKGGQIFGNGYGITIREMLGSNFEVDGADIKTYFANPSAARPNGVGFASGASSASTTRGGHLRVRNNNIEYTGTDARPGIYLVYESGFASGATTDVTVEGNNVLLTTALATAVVVQGITTSAGSLRSIKVRNNPGVRGGGFDLRHGTAILLDDNDQSGGTDVGALIRNSSTAATDQVAYARRNRFSACAFAGISVLGDATNKFVQVKLEDNDFSGVSATNQGSASNECAIVAANVTTLTMDRNTNPTAGANQTFSYNIASTVATAFVRDNRSAISGGPILAATTILQKGNQWQADAGFSHVDTTAVGNVGSGTDTLMTVSMPVGTWAKAKSGVRIVGWGTTANNSNPKTVKLQLSGSDILTTALTVSQAGKWFVEAFIIATGTDTQDYVSKLNEYGTTVQTDCENGNLALNDGAALTINFTGAVTDGGGGINNNDIVQEGFIVEPLR